MVVMQLPQKEWPQGSKVSGSLRGNMQTGQSPVARGDATKFGESMAVGGTSLAIPCLGYLRKVADATKGLEVRVLEVIYDDDFLPCVDELEARMAANVARPASHQDPFARIVSGDINGAASAEFGCENRLVVQLPRERAG